MDFSLIGFTETRICNSDNLDSLPLLPGYCFEYVPTPLSAGGVAFYINNRLNYKIVERSSNIHFQALWIELLNPKSKNTLCGVIYRQHNDAEVFLEYLSDRLEEFNCSNKNIFVLGDFNIDFLRYETSMYNQAMLDLIHSLSFFPTVDKPTRIYGRSATLIDNIFSNDLDSFQITGNIVSDVSDHFIQICISSSEINLSPRPNIKIRDYSKFNPSNFIADLQNVDWGISDAENDVQKLFSRFYKKLKSIVRRILGVRTCELFSLFCHYYVRSVYCFDFIDFFVLRHS